MLPLQPSRSWSRENRGSDARSREQEGLAQTLSWAGLDATLVATMFPCSLPSRPCSGIPADCHPRACQPPHVTIAGIVACDLSAIAGIDKGLVEIIAAASLGAPAI